MTTRAYLEASAAEIGTFIASVLPHGVGFALLVYDFGEKGNLGYVSNGKREDMLKAMREFIEKNERGESSAVGRS